MFEFILVGAGAGFIGFILGTAVSNALGEYWPYKAKVRELEHKEKMSYLNAPEKGQWRVEYK